MGQNILGLKNFKSKNFAKKHCFKKVGSKKCLKKILGPKNIWVQKNVRSEKNFGSKKLGSTNMFGRKQFRFQKNFGSKEILGPNILGPKNFRLENVLSPKKIVGPKNLSLKNILSQKFLVPPPLPYIIGLSKVGWIGRGGVRMRVPFLGFHVAYIPNLRLLQSLEPFEKGIKI